MGPLEVKNVILRAFQDIKLSSYVVLETIENGQHLIKADLQDLDGVGAIKRRGCLYLCQKYEVIYCTMHTHCDTKPRFCAVIIWLTEWHHVNIINMCLAVLFHTQLLQTVNVSSDTDSDGNDIVRTTYLSTSPHQSNKMSELIKKSDKLLKQLKV